MPTRYLLALALVLFLPRPGIATTQPEAPLLPPVSSACISSPFGPRVLPNRPLAGTYHYGVDMPAPAGAAVRATAPGRVIRIQRKGAGGLEVMVQHDGFIGIYSHLGMVTPALAQGKTALDAGEKLGVVGHSGLTYGMHVYFGMLKAGKPIDPTPYLGVPLCHGGIYRTREDMIGSDGRIPPTRHYAGADSGGLDSLFNFLLLAVMRAAALLVGLCLVTPALGAPRGDPACTAMLMPPEQLREVSRGFGHGHTGIDLMAPYGSPIRAAAGGVVMYTGWYFAYGNIVDIRHADGLITRYAHMSAFAPGIAPGTPVAPGGIIGSVGMTGRAHGPHVHFEVRVAGHPIDPRPFLALAPCRRAAPEPLEEAHAPEVGRPDR